MNENNHSGDIWKKLLRLVEVVKATPLTQEIPASPDLPTAEEAEYAAKILRRYLADVILAGRQNLKYKFNLEHRRVLGIRPHPERPTWSVFELESKNLGRIDSKPLSLVELVEFVKGVMD